MPNFEFIVRGLDVFSIIREMVGRSLLARFYGEGATAAQAFAACQAEKARFRLTEDGILLFDNRSIVEYSNFEGWTVSPSSNKPKAASDGWRLPLKPKVMFNGKWNHLRSELCRWFDSNPAVLNLTSDFAEGAFTSRCLNIFRESDVRLFYVDKIEFTVTFAHEIYGEVNLFVPHGVAGDVIFPVSVSPKMSDKTRELHERSSAGMNSWSCSLELGRGLSGCYYHHCTAAGANPLRALKAASLVAKNQIRMLPNGDFYLGSSFDRTWKFNFIEATWRHPENCDSGKYHDSTSDWRLKEFDEDMVTVIWKRAEAHPEIAGRLLLEMVAM